MHYILVDYENIQPDLNHLAMDSLVDVTVFVGATQVTHSDTNAALVQLDERGECIKVLKAGPNALDFHLVFHLGQLVMANPQASFEIISHDKGYDPLIEHLNGKGIHINRTAGTRRNPIPKVKKRSVRIKSTKTETQDIAFQAE